MMVTEKTTTEGKRGNPKVNYAAVKRLHAEGVSQTEIAEMFGVTRGRIWQIVHGYGYIPNVHPQD